MSNDKPADAAAVEADALPVKAKRGGARPGAGRPPGAPNKATRELKALAQTYTPKAVKALAQIMLDATAPHAARVTAATALLDRGHGRPTQHTEHGGAGGGAIQVEMRIAAVRKLIDAAFGEPGGDEPAHGANPGGE